MATFSQIRDTVYGLTNRPDLVTETVIGVRKALLKFHLADSWKQDLQSTEIVMADHVPYEPFRWNIPFTAFIRHRRAYDLRPPLPIHNLPPPSGGNSIFYPPYNQIQIRTSFEFLTENNLFDSYHIEKPNYFYVAGSSLIIKATWIPERLIYHYFKYPLFASTEAENNIESWIADQFPDAIAEEAAGAVFKAIGKDDEASTYRALFGENLQLLKGTDVGES